VGNTNINNKNLCVIDVDYEFFFQNTKEKIAKGSLFLATAGYSKQRLYWDQENGILDHYTEEFRIKMSDVYNNLVEFRGVSKAEITQAKFSNNKKNVEKLQKTVEDLDLKDVNIKEGSKGLTISIENIQFEPDSAVLLDSEKKKLDIIATLLQDFSNDILITGHCAERGSESARQVLSEQRAESVASYLKQLGVRDAYHIFSQGKGSTEPIASNATEEGRQKNRRVEIIVLN
jgi:outer membrane protein OmpA-like peptidoglycan-associated protein